MSLENFPVTVDLPVLWGDQDLFGHVNNTIHLKWFESSRVAYWDASGMREIMQPKNWGPILASVSCDYLKQIRYPDNIEVGARVAEIRRSSFTIEHEIYSEANSGVAARGKSVIVLFDYTHQRPQRITDDLRDVIATTEGGTS